MLWMLFCIEDSIFLIGKKPDFSKGMRNMINVGRHKNYKKNIEKRRQKTMIPVMRNSYKIIRRANL